MTRRGTMIALIAATAVIVACDVSSSTNLSGCMFVCDMKFPPDKPFEIGPNAVAVLRGDTARFLACSHVFACAELVMDAGNVNVRWSVPNDSVLSFVRPTGYDTIVASSNHVLIRALREGQVNVSAWHEVLGTTYARVRVADSSAIVRIIVERDGLGADSLRPGHVIPFTIYLRDSFGVTFQASPTAYSLSDSTVLSVEPTTKWGKIPQATVHALKPGTAELRIHFLSLTQVVPLRVVP